MKYPQILLQNRKPDRIATLDEYRQSGGYQALTNVLEKYAHKDVQDTILESKLLGRGGVAFDKSALIHLGACFFDANQSKHF